METRLSYRQHTRAVLALGLPLVGSHLAQFAIQLTDTIMLGWYDVDELAAVVLAGTFWFMLFIVGSGFAFAVMPLVATAAASGDDADVRRATRMGMWLSVLFGAAVMPLILLSEPILVAMGQDPKISMLAGTYLGIAGWSIFPALLVMVLKSYFAALERTQFVLWTTVVAVFVNAAINYALIFGNWGAPEMGLRGAAYASLTVNVFSLALLCIYGLRAFPEHLLFQRLWRPDWPGFARVFHLGWPIGMTNFAEVGLFAVSTVMMGWLGTLELAAHGIALEITAVTFMIHVGLSNAATVRAGQAYARRNEVELRRGGLVVIAISAVVALATVIVLLSVPELLVGTFVDPDDPLRPQIIAIGTGLLVLAALYQLADAGQVVVLGLLRGVQDTKIPMAMATFSYWVVAIPAGYYLTFTMGYGANGVWLGLVIGLTVAWVTLSVRFWARSVKVARSP